MTARPIEHPMIDDYEDVTGYTLDDSTETELLAAQNECSFIWANHEGWPVGVIMNYVFRDGRFWLTAARHRKRVRAIERDPRVSVCVTSLGTSLRRNKTVTYKGLATVHPAAGVSTWFYPALAGALRPDDDAGQRELISFLDSPGRVVIEVVPTQRIAFDGAKLRAATDESLARRGR